VVVIEHCSTECRPYLLLRAPTAQLLQEAQVCFAEVLRVLAKTLASSPPSDSRAPNDILLVGGGGAFENYLSTALLRRAATLHATARLGFEAFAEALLVVPQVLAENAGADAATLLANLRQRSFSGTDSDTEDVAALGLDASLVGSQPTSIVNVFEAAIVEPMHLKLAVIRNAVEAATSVLAMFPVSITGGG